MLYFYTYRLRGYSIGCQPRNVYAVATLPEYKYEVISYERELTQEELEEYELIFIELPVEECYHCRRPARYCICP